MIDIVITSFNEPKSTLHLAKDFLKQLKGREGRVIVVDPFESVGEYLGKEIKDPKFKFILDPGEGKSYALNMIFQDYGSSNTEDLFVLTDGDVNVSPNTLHTILNAFKNKKIGCVTARPVPLDKRDTKYGYWAHLFFSGIHKARKEFSRNKKFFECSGYLFTIRKGVISDFPLETSEDSIIPYLFWKKGYLIKYIPEIEVYVKNPSNWRDWINQKTRNIKAHENLNKIAPDMPRTKSFFNEIKLGTLFALSYPKNLREVFWTAQAFLARFYIYYKSFFEINKGKSYADGWRGEAETASTRIDYL